MVVSSGVVETSTDVEAWVKRVVPLLLAGAETVDMSGKVGVLQRALQRSRELNVSKPLRFGPKSVGFCTSA